MIKVDVCETCNRGSGVLEQVRVAYEGLDAEVSYSGCLGLCSLGSRVSVTRDGQTVYYASSYREGVRNIRDLARDVEPRMSDSKS